MNKALEINSNKAVLLSIKKQWLEKILSGEKTIEVRKTMPWEISYPFVVFCYETKANGGAGKVTAAFVCRDINTLDCLRELPAYAIGTEVTAKTAQFVKDSCLTANELIAYGNKSGTSVNIFYTKEKCVKCYREQVRQANEIYEKEKARIIKEFDARIQILNDSLTPFNDVPQSDYTVVAKMDVTNDSLGYNEKNRHFYLETTRTMIPTRYTIEMLKMQALIGLVDELRANTTWQKGVPFRILIRTTVFVDGIEDVSQATTESQTITL